MNKFVFIIFWISIISYSSLSQDNDEFFGVNLNYNYVISSADFQALPGIPNCCPRFDYGYDYNLGVSFFYRSFLSDNWNLQYDFRYLNLSSKFESKESETFGTSNGFIQGEFTHYLEAEIDLLSINPSLAYNYYNFNFNFGFALSYYLNKRYNQREQITQPFDRGTFLDSMGNDSGNRIRNANSGNLKSSRDFGFSLIPRISYKLPLNKEKSIFLEPTISTEFNLLDISKEMNWSSLNLSAGLSLVFQLDNFNEEYFELLPIDSIQPLPIDSLDYDNNRELIIKNDFDKAFNPVYLNTIDTLVNSISEQSENKYKQGKTLIEYDTIVIKKRLTIRKTKLRYDTIGIDNSQEFLNILIKDDKDKNINKIEIRELILNNYFPILNKIFYEKNQVSISNNFKSVNSSELPYYSIFDTLSNRYKGSGNKIFLNLIESDGDLISDTLRLQLLKKFLNEEKGIDYDDIEINYLETNNISKLSIIEINSKDLIEPFEISDTIKKTNFDDLKLHINHNIKSRIDNLNLFVKSDSITILEREYKTFSNFLEIDIDELIDQIDNTTNSLNFEVIAIANNKQFKSKQNIKVNINSIEKNKILNKKIEKSNKRTIINFAYNSYELSKENIELLAALNESIKVNANVEIIGYTDDIGNPEYNKVLSLQRANEVRKHIKNGNIYVKGEGTNKKYQSLKTLESKIYSRCVEIIISEN